MISIIIFIVIFVILWFSTLKPMLEKEKESFKILGFTLFYAYLLLGGFTLLLLGCYTRYENPILKEIVSIQALNKNIYVAKNQTKDLGPKYDYWKVDSIQPDIILSNDIEVIITESTLQPHLEIKHSKKIKSLFIGFLADDKVIYEFFIPKNGYIDKTPPKSTESPVESKEIEVNVTAMYINRNSNVLKKDKYYIEFMYNDKEYFEEVPKNIFYYYYDEKNIQKPQKAKLYCIIKGDEILQIKKDE